jgi:hypothetical protein
MNRPAPISYLLAPLCLLAVYLSSCLDTSAQERFREIVITNSGYNVMYLGTNQNTATFTNGIIVGGQYQTTNTLGATTNLPPANWINIADCYGAAITLKTAVSTGNPNATNGGVVFQLNAAYDLGNNGLPPQANVLPMPFQVVSNWLSISNPIINGSTSYAAITFPSTYQSNLHWIQWAQTFIQASNGVMTNATGYDTNGIHVQTFKLQYYR